jgi:hypothetical protein
MLTRKNAKALSRRRMSHRFQAILDARHIFLRALVCHQTLQPFAAARTEAGTACLNQAHHPSSDSLQDLARVPGDPALSVSCSSCTHEHGLRGHCCYVRHLANWRLAYVANCSHSARIRVSVRLNSHYP